MVEDTDSRLTDLSGTPNSSRTFRAVRENNYVFRPRSREQWMAMFGSDGF